MCKDNMAYSPVFVASDDMKQNQLQGRMIIALKLSSLASSPHYHIVTHIQSFCQVNKYQ